MAARGVIMTPYAVKTMSTLNEVFEKMIKKLKGRMIRDLTKVQFHNSSESLHLSQSIFSELIHCTVTCAPGIDNALFSDIAMRFSA